MSSGGTYKMNIRIYVYLTTALEIVASLNWAVFDEGQCYYSMVATDLPPNRMDQIHKCDYTEPYITVIVKNTTVKNISSDLFNSTDYPWIKIFKATDNLLEPVQSYAFSNFKNIMYIDLSNNNINNIGMAFKGLEALDFLNLSRNQIEEINSETFTISRNKTKLHLLDLSYNLLTHLSNNTFENVWNLRMLYLQGNRIKMIKDEPFVHLRHLIFLNLCCNNLTELNTTMKGLSSLTELNLSSNELEHFYENTLSCLILLEEIDLSSNKLESLPDNFLSRSTQLSEINLASNKITNMSRYINKYSYLSLH